MRVHKQVTYDFKLSKKKSVIIEDNNGKISGGIIDSGKVGEYFDHKELKAFYKALKEVFGEINDKADPKTTKAKGKSVKEIMSDEQAKQTAEKPTPMFKPATWVGAPPQ